MTSTPARVWELVAASRARVRHITGTRIEKFDPSPGGSVLGSTLPEKLNNMPNGNNIKKL